MSGYRFTRGRAMNRLFDGWDWAIIFLILSGCAIMVYSVPPGLPQGMVAKIQIRAN